MEGGTAAAGSQSRFTTTEVSGQAKVQNEDMKGLWVYEDVLGLDVSVRDEDGPMQC